jgi:hypothetical protein
MVNEFLTDEQRSALERPAGIVSYHLTSSRKCAGLAGLPSQSVLSTPRQSVGKGMSGPDHSRPVDRTDDFSVLPRSADRSGWSVRGRLNFRRSASGCLCRVRVLPHSAVSYLLRSLVAWFEKKQWPILETGVAFNRGMAIAALRRSSNTRSRCSLHRLRPSSKVLVRLCRVPDSNSFRCGPLSCNGHKNYNGRT